MLVALTAIISGFSIFINAFGVKGFDSSVFTFSKNIVVAILLITTVLALGQWSSLRELTARQWRKLALIGLIGGSIPFLLFFKGLQMTTGTTGAFLHKTLFVFVALFALFTIKEKLSKGWTFAAGLLIAGAFLMIRPDLAFSSGHLLILGAVVFWAAENVLAKHTVKDMSGTIVALGRMGFGSLFILAFLLVTGKGGIVLAMSGAQWGWIMVTSAFLFGYVLSYYNGLMHIEVSTAAAILTLGLPITTALQYLFLGASVTPLTAAGMLLIVCGAATLVIVESNLPKRWGMIHATRRD